ncbi:MAG TPA: NAD(P)-binding domain-containing protein [Spirochaetota bacterium]
MKTVGFIGGGRIVNIMLKGLSSAGKLPSDVTVYDSDPAAGKKLTEKFKGINVTGKLADAASADVVVLAIHPQAIADVAAETAKYLKKDAFVLSLVPKIKVAKTIELLGGHTRVARMNPNAPSLVNKGFNPISYSPSCTADDRKLIDDLFGSLGAMPEVEDAQIDAFAVITALGYTYIDYQCAELYSLAKQFGLPEELAARGIKTLFAGAAETVLMKDADLDVLNLVPARPLAEQEESVKGLYHTKLSERYAMLAQ